MKCLPRCQAEALVRSLRPSKFFLQFAIIHFNQRRAAVRTGVGHRATAQILDEIFQFRAGRAGRWPSPRGGRRSWPRVLAEPREIHLAAGGLNSSTRSNTNRRVSAPSRTAAARRAETSARQIRSSRRRAGQRGKLLAQKLGVARRQFNRLRQQQFLRRRDAA